YADAAGPAKVCPFCYAPVPLEAAVCPRCEADLVQYRPGRGPVRDQANKKAFRAILILFGGIFAVAAAIGVYYPLVNQHPRPLTWHETGSAAGLHFVVVPRDEAMRNTDLWRIADQIRGGNAAIDVMFWTDATAAPTTALPTTAQRGTMVAEIVVDPARGVKELRRRGR
ncbi:MAG: hypothetical protein KGN76_00785, partial [Acidobacteriota bacterium]|nr:hypothetical protein [Acidobacteriota bacterium]